LAFASSSSARNDRGHPHKLMSSFEADVPAARYVKRGALCLSVSYTLRVKVKHNAWSSATLININGTFCVCKDDE
jgi:hypothetical protein